MSGFLAYIERNEAHAAALSAMRTAVRDARRVATVVGFGPRFLHSTGQVYKGGPGGRRVPRRLPGSADPDFAIPGQPGELWAPSSLRRRLATSMCSPSAAGHGCAFTRGKTWMPDLKRSAGSIARTPPEN